MKYEINPLDPLSIPMLTAYQKGAMQNTSPCSVCRGLGDHVMVRNHFHGSDMGACRRKVYRNMIAAKGNTSSSNSAFLKDGHLHEAMVLETIAEGFGEEAKITSCQNNEELTVHINMGDETGVLLMRIIGHHDGEIEYRLPRESMDQVDVHYVHAIIECKAVKDYTFKKVKDGNISNEWYGQMQFYMMAKRLRVAYLIVKNRITSSILPPIRFEIDLPWLKERIKGLKEIYTLVNTTGEVEPPAKEHKNSKADECQFCPHKDDCWNPTEQVNVEWNEENKSYDESTI